MNDAEQKKAINSFINYWKDKGREDEDDYPFWLQLLQDVYEIEDASKYIVKQKKVSVLEFDGKKHRRKIDIFIPSAKVLIEQKSLGVDLGKKSHQSGGDLLTPYEQAKRYNDWLGKADAARWIIVCNFAEFWVYDMNKPADDPVKISLEELTEKYHLLSFLVDPNIKKIIVQQQLSFKAGALVGKLYDLMLPQYNNTTATSTLQSLNKFCVRIVFCLYAEDAKLFGPKGSEFHDYLASFLPENRRKALIALFRILDTPEADRDPYEEPKLLNFPYVNGGLFSGEIEIPKLSDEITKLILEDMSENLDWSKISPTIFGAVFESTLNPETRRSGGMHYTSIENIHKVIDPLFLNNLQDEFIRITTKRMSAFNRRAALEEFHNKLSKLHFLDPACGSGNFLTETFLSLRKLENEVIKKLDKSITSGQVILDVVIKISIGQFAGIEVNDFAVSVAKTALWIAESQMIKETEAIVNQAIKFFPLKTDAKIIEGNALRMDWNDVISNDKLNYIMGNPPFNGARKMKPTQKNDIIQVVEVESGDTQKYKNFSKNLDYVGAWYYKAARYIKGKNIKVGFVSTSSICQGQQVYPLWNTLINDYHMKIEFAYKPFKWYNETENQAQVIVIVIGFTNASTTNEIKNIFDTHNNSIFPTENISPYLLPIKTTIVKSEKNPINNMPKMVFGSMPRDGGNLIFSKEEGENIIKKYPNISPYILKYMGGDELTNGTYRYCLWLLNAPQGIKTIPFIKNIIQKVYNFRINSTAHTTNGYARVAYRFAQVAQPENGTYIAVPKVSTGRREYIPMDFLNSDIIASDLLLIIPNATILHFGLLSSSVHMVWSNIVGGKLGDGSRYSKDIVYNTFPIPNMTEQQINKIKKTAQAILDARKLYPEFNLKNLGSL